MHRPHWFTHGLATVATQESSKGPSMAEQTHPFHVALTGDFYDAAGAPRYRDFGLDVFADERQIEHRAFAAHQPEISPDQVGNANGLIVLTPRVTARSVSNSADLLAIARFGVGYDSVDLAACTAADVAVFITTGAVDRSVAEATLTWMLALTHHVRAKDHLVRTGDWDARSRLMGCELRQRTLGVVGFGGIARALLSLLSSFGMQPPLAFDPYLDPAVGARHGVQMVSLDELLAKSDFVSIHCPLTDQTRNLIGARELALMRPGAYLINTARGGIVDEDALYAAVHERRIAGAAIDTFATEPVVTPHRLGELDNVLLAPHSIAWTDELFRDIGRAACRGMVDFSRGVQPPGIVNPQVLERPGFQQKWSRWRAGR